MSLPPLYLKQKQGADPYLGNMSHTDMYNSIVSCNMYSATTYEDMH